MQVYDAVKLDTVRIRCRKPGSDLAKHVCIWSICIVEAWSIDELNRHTWNSMAIIDLHLLGACYRVSVSDKEGDLPHTSVKVVPNFNGLVCAMRDEGALARASDTHKSDEDAPWRTIWARHRAPRDAAWRALWAEYRVPRHLPLKIFDLAWSITTREIQSRDAWTHSVVSPECCAITNYPHCQRPDTFTPIFDYPALQITAAIVMPFNCKEIVPEMIKKNRSTHTKEIPRQNEPMFHVNLTCLPIEFAEAVRQGTGFPGRIFLPNVQSDFVLDSLKSPLFLLLVKSTQRRQMKCYCKMISRPVVRFESVMYCTYCIETARGSTDASASHKAAS